MSRMHNDAWFSGFSDGEACFILNKQPTGLIIPRFSLSLRADDKAVQTGLHEAFGGVLYWAPASPSTPNSAPQHHWRVTAKRDLAGLVRYFDLFPLRAKKAGDFKVWRLAVKIYCADGGRDPRLEELREALMAGRGFHAEPADLEPITGAQMELSA